MASWLKGNFSPKSHFWWNNFRLQNGIKKNKISQFSRKSFESFFAKKYILRTSGAKIFFYKWNLKKSYFAIGIEKIICFKFFFDI